MKKVSIRKTAALCLFLFVISGLVSQTYAQVSAGPGEFFRAHHYILRGKRVGVICNQTSLMPDGRHLVDELVDKNMHVTALFSPEHGIRGDMSAGRKVEQEIDPVLGIPVYSLYGKNNKPTKEMLKDVDVLLFDMQDVGARFYTYISTMAYCMQAAAENKKRFIVLDRPNPINGIDVEGPVLDTAFSSFVGLFPIPIRHGLTVGELARMICFDWWKMDSLDIVVIPMRGWTRDMWLDEIAVQWTSPSPNIKTFQTMVVYPGTCLFEGTNVSEGRGTTHPFQYVGAPWIDEKLYAQKMNEQNLAGVTFDPIRFTPQADSIAAPYPKYKGIECGGLFINVKEKKDFKPVSTAITMLSVLKSLYPDSLTFQEKMFDRLAGNSSIRTSIEQGKPIDWNVYQPKFDEFMKLRSDYLLY